MPAARSRPTLTAVLSDFPPALRELLRADCTWDDDATAALWTSYFASRSAADQQALVNHYMPSVATMVCRAVNGRAKLFPDNLETYLSDGMLGLIQFIRSCKEYRPGITGPRCLAAIRKAVWNEERRRSWHGKSRVERSRTIELLRAKLVRELGRMPTRDEVFIQVKTQLKNPRVYFEFVDHDLESMQSKSQFDDDSNGELSTVDDAPQPVDQVLHAELCRLMLKGLKGQDRKMFRCLMRGMQPIEIARKFGLYPNIVSQRLNGLLWEARQRADLATYIDANAGTVIPAKDKWNHLPAFNLAARLKAVG